jgi:hypothetical protein
MQIKKNMNYLYLLGGIFLFILVIGKFYSAGEILGELAYKILN